MSLTREESKKVYKKEVMEQSKTTPSPLDDPEVKKEVMEIAKAEYGDEVISKLKNDEFNKEEIKTKNVLQPKDILNVTDHLQNFELVKNVISLQGDEYTMISKEIYKTLISLAIPEHLRIIRVGDIKTDLRLHPTSILSSGKGKKNICEALKKIYLAFKPDANIKEPRTIHYQHLIGKMLLRKEEEEIGQKKDGSPKYKKVDKWIPKYGYLNADILILEESYEVFNSQEKNDVDCRDAITVALDCFGDNLIQKQNMDNLDTKEETLAYNPYVTIIPFLQPLKMSESFITKGLSRRLHICYKDFPERTKLDKYVNRLTSKIDDSKSCFAFSQYMKKINQLKTKWELSSEAIDVFTICHAALLEQGFRQGGKVSHYTRILEFPMQNLLLKMSAIQSASNLRTKITTDDVKMAFIDIIERLVHEFQYVERKVKGTLDYGESWAGAVGKSQECLERLYKKGAISKETSIPIWQFQEMISEIYPLSIRRARDRYKEMIKEELICDYKGQGKENGVWLNFEPKTEFEQMEDDEELLNPKRLYFEYSGRTDKSGRTPKTGLPLIIKTDISSYIDNTNDKTTDSPKASSVKTKNKKIVGKQKTPKTSIHVLPVLPDQPQSTRDVHYSEAEECKNIKPCKVEEVKSYLKEHPKAKIPELLEQFGPGVIKLKKEELI